MAAKIDSNYVLAALRSGFSEIQIANGLGVTQSAVQQHIEEHGLASMAAQNSKFQNIDSKLLSLEDALLDRLAKRLPLEVSLSAPKIAGIYRIINSAKRRSLGEGPNIQNTNVLVSLNLPARELPKVVVSKNNEVVEVDGRVLQTLPSAKISEEHRVYEAAKKLPPSAEVKDYL